MYKSISLSVLWNCATPVAHSKFSGPLEITHKLRNFAGSLLSVGGPTLIISSHLLPVVFCCLLALVDSHNAQATRVCQRDLPFLHILLFKLVVLPASRSTNCAFALQFVKFT